MKLIKKEESEIVQEQKPIVITPTEKALDDTFGDIEQSDKERDGFAKLILTQTFGTCYSDGTPTEKLEVILSGIKNIKPKDHIEGMLMAQIIATHNAVMKSFNKAAAYYNSSNTKTLELANACLNSANKLTRTYTMQMEALNRYRGKGQQKMTIEHVNINSGSQAIIGNIAPIKNNRGEGENK